MKKHFVAIPGKGIFASNQIDSKNITEKEIIQSLKRLRKEYGYSVNIKNGGYVISTYERDMYFAGRIQTLLEAVREELDAYGYYDDPDYLDEVVSECMREISETNVFLESL